MTDFAERMNRLGAEQLRAAGSLKWTAFGEALGAWVAEMDFGVAEPIRTAMRRYGESELFGYAPAGLVQDLTRATSEYYGRNFQWTPHVQDVVPTGDVLSALAAVIDFYMPTNGPVIVPTPAYMPFLQLPGLRGRKVIEVPMHRDTDGWRLDLEGIEAALARNGALLILCNPHNPIGKIYRRDELLALSRVVARQHARVFVDEIHASITFDGAAHVPYASISPAAAQHAITATSAAKTFNIPGLKCAQLIFSNRQDRDIWAERGFFVSHGASVPGMLATIAAYDQADAWHAEVMDYLLDSRRLLARLLREKLPQVRWIPPEATYLAWLDVSGLQLEGNPQEFMLERAGVALVDGAQCGQGNEDFLRLNFATSHQLLEDIVERMAAAAGGSPVRDH